MQAARPTPRVRRVYRRQAPLATEASEAEPLAGRETLHHFGNLIQTDARLPVGSSGGALINLSGEMVGLTSSLAALSNGETDAGFAIPVDDAFKRVVETLKLGQRPDFGFLGVEPKHAIDVGSEIVTRRVAPARTAFSTISYEQRAVERMNPAAGSCPARASAPISLSRALCRPTSSRARTIVPSKAANAAACAAPVALVSGW